MAIFLPVVLAFMTFIAIFFLGQYGLYGGIVLIAVAVVYCVRQAVLAHQALERVRA